MFERETYSTSNSASLAAALGCGGNNLAACLRDQTHQEIVDLQDQVVQLDVDVDMFLLKNGSVIYLKNKRLIDNAEWRLLEISFRFAQTWLRHVSSQWRTVTW